MFDRLKAIEEKYLDLLAELENPEVSSDYKKASEVSKQISELEEIVNLYKDYTALEDEEREVGEMLKQDNLKTLAEAEINVIKTKREEIIEKIKLNLIPKDARDDKNIILEIRGAAGGDEANIFAGDLLRMYTYYAEKNGWKTEMLNSQEGTSGGFATVSCLIKGKSVYSKLKYENGSHRVQRIPVTETQGRVHTSTATVHVTAEMDDVNVEVKESDLKIDTFHSSGAGGQSVNTTNSAVRITHIPSGIVVTCQNERSQIKNKDRALKSLKMKLYEIEVEKQMEESDASRKNKIGSGDRSEKIRTYNYPQNRVTDHRINLTVMNLDKVMEGELDKIIDALTNEDMKQKLEGEGL